MTFASYVNLGPISVRSVSVIWVALFSGMAFWQYRLLVNGGGVALHGAKAEKELSGRSMVKIDA